MTVVYYDLEKSEHVTIRCIDRIETCIDADILVVYYWGEHKKEYICLEKQWITSINIDYNF